MVLQKSSRVSCILINNVFSCITAVVLQLLSWQSAAYWHLLIHPTAKITPFAIGGREANYQAIEVTAIDEGK